MDIKWPANAKINPVKLESELNAIPGIIENGFFSMPIFETYRTYMDDRRVLYTDGKQRDMTLMDIAVIGMKALRAEGKLDDLDASEEINACSICITVDVNGKDEDWLLMFKNETHNHPTEIEPFGGAATCLGGAIRDPLSGRSYVYQAMRVTGAWDPRVPIEDTLQGKLPQKKITIGAAEGYSSYGNQIGLATGQVREIYHKGYLAKRMEIGAVIGAAPAAQDTGDAVFSDDDSCSFQIKRANQTTARQHMPLYTNSPQIS